MDQISHYINDIKTIQQEMCKLFEHEDDDEYEAESQQLDDDDVIDMLECMDEYINEHPKIITDPDFDEIFLQEMQTLFPCCENIEEIIELFHLWFLPKRSQRHDDADEEEEEVLKEDSEVIKQKIAYLHAQPQHTQRTPEWYEFRNNLITASNAYKIFETSATRNQLIYEKCTAFAKMNKNEENEENKENEKAPVNIETSLHWGQKYEPVSVLIYEKMSGTKVEEFGCIKHPIYDFLGASPDGIIVDPASPKY